jgi:hypothetical protein
MPVSRRLIADSIADIVPLRDRGKYQGVGEAIIIIADGLGPLMGIGLTLCRKHD